MFLVDYAVKLTKTNPVCSFVACKVDYLLFCLPKKLLFLSPSLVLLSVVMFPVYEAEAKQIWPAVWLWLQCVELRDNINVWYEQLSSSLCDV